jgi:branched-chain amino acid transport system ATP-binding protein
VQEIYRIIRRLKEEGGAAMLLVEQNARMALDVADFGYVLEGGRIVLDGSAERLRSNEDVKEFYLGIRDAGVRGVRRWKRKKQWR